MPDEDKVLNIQRVSVNKKSIVEFDIVLPKSFTHSINLDFACDSYIGLDFTLTINLNKANQVLKELRENASEQDAKFEDYKDDQVFCYF